MPGKPDDERAIVAIVCWPPWLHGGNGQRTLNEALIFLQTTNPNGQYSSCMYLTPLVSDSVQILRRQCCLHPIQFNPICSIAVLHTSLDGLP